MANGVAEVQDAAEVRFPLVPVYHANLYPRRPRNQSIHDFRILCQNGFQILSDEVEQLWILNDAVLDRFVEAGTVGAG